MNNHWLSVSYSFCRTLGTALFKHFIRVTFLSAIFFLIKIINRDYSEFRIVELLVEQGSIIETPDSKGNTAYGNNNAGDPIGLAPCFCLE